MYFKTSIPDSFFFHIILKILSNKKKTTRIILLGGGQILLHTNDAVQCSSSIHMLSSCVTEPMQFVTERKKNTPIFFLSSGKGKDNRIYFGNEKFIFSFHHRGSLSETSGNRINSYLSKIR